VRINVDLPQPDGPIKAVTDPAVKSKLIFERTWFLPNQAWIPRVSQPVPWAVLTPVRAGFAFATLAREFGVVDDMDFSLSGV
jgi:hypothetical protein